MSDYWFAPKSGYRRRGTTIQEIRALFEQGITAQDVRESLNCCTPEEKAPIVRRRMEDANFDVLGVRPGDDSAPVGYVRRTDLESGQCKNYIVEFDGSELISDSTPLVQLLSVLRERQQSFVLVGDEVSGIVTRADLQKPPVRLYLFGLVTLLEMHLGALARHHYTGDEWTDELSESRIDKAVDLQSEREKRNQELDLMNCLQLCDKRELVLASESLRGELNIRSKTQGRNFLKAAQDLRDDLAHANELALDRGWDEVVDVVVAAEDLIQQSEEYFTRMA